MTAMQQWRLGEWRRRLMHRVGGHRCLLYGAAAHSNVPQLMCGSSLQHVWIHQQG
jgi:hypothetical protein